MPSKKRFLVLGSNSFSGNDLVDLLLSDANHEVMGISRSPEPPAFMLAYSNNPNRANYHFLQFDLNHHLGQILEAIDSFKPDYIFNFAAQSEVAPSWDNPDHWYQTNVLSFGKLIHELKDRKFIRRYVHISSPEVYGTCEGRVLEDAPLQPSTPYASSKAAADLLMLPYVKNFDFPLVTIRATNVYGARQQLFKIIPRSVIYIKSDRPIELHGGGKAVKSYIHIRDVSRGELAAAINGKVGSIYHLSPDQGYEVRDIVSRICHMMNKDFKAATRVVEERLGQDAAYVIDSTKARTELGWRPEVTIDQGLAEVQQWVEANWPAIKTQELRYVHKA